MSRCGGQGCLNVLLYLYMMTGRVLYANGLAVRLELDGVTGAWSTPTPSSTQNPDRWRLYKTSQPPEHMAFVWWDWVSSGQRRLEFEELVIDFTVHNDIGNFSSRQGIYLMPAQSSISGVGFYFGIQTSVHDPRTGGGGGKGLLFSRWKAHDLENAGVAPGSWSQSSGHEGGFIGVRYPYEWTAGGSASGSWIWRREPRHGPGR